MRPKITPKQVEQAQKYCNIAGLKLENLGNSLRVYKDYNKTVTISRTAKARRFIVTGFLYQDNVTLAQALSLIGKYL